MGSQLIVAVVVEALYRGVLDRPVHSLDLTVRPRMVGFGQAMLDPVGLADHVEAHWPRVDGVPVPGLLGELDAIIGKNRVDLVGHGFEHVLQELPSCLSISRFNELSDSKFGSSIDADEQVELPLSGLHLGDVYVEEPDGVALELLALWFVPFDIRQTRDAVSLQAPMQRRACQVRDGWLQGLEAVVQRQQRVPPESHDGRLISLGQDCRARFRWPGLHILDSRALPPLRNRLGVYTQLFAQLRERSLRSLYCSSDGVRGRGAHMTNLSHTASFHS